MCKFRVRRAAEPRGARVELWNQSESENMLHGLLGFSIKYNVLCVKNRKRKRKKGDFCWCAKIHREKLVGEKYTGQKLLCDPKKNCPERSPPALPDGRGGPRLLSTEALEEKPAYGASLYFSFPFLILQLLRVAWAGLCVCKRS